MHVWAQGCNSIDIWNLRLELRRKLRQGLRMRLGRRRCLLNCTPGSWIFDTWFCHQSNFLKQKYDYKTQPKYDKSDCILAESQSSRRRLRRVHFDSSEFTSRWFAVKGPPTPQQWWGGRFSSEITHPNSQLGPLHSLSLCCQFCPVFSMLSILSCLVSQISTLTAYK